MMLRLDRALVVAVSMVLLTSCAATLDVYDTGSGLKVVAKPKDCGIPLLRTKAPERSYVEIATLHWTGGLDGYDPPAAERKVRERACELGADAVVINQWVPGNPGKNGRPPQMRAIAIVYQAASGTDAAAAAAK